MYTPEEFTQHVQNIADRAIPLLGDFKKRADASDKPRLIARNFSFAFGYSPLVDGPTLLLQARDPGDEEQATSIPFPGRIPDPLGDDPDKTMQRIQRWLENDGEAINTLDAQLMEADMVGVKDVAQKALAKTYGQEKSDAVRIPLTDETITELTQKNAKEFTSENMLNLARLRHAKNWLNRHSALLESAYMGVPITAQSKELLARDSIPALDESSRDPEQLVLSERLRAVSRILSAVKERLPSISKGRNAITVAYDPKPVTRDEIIFSKGKGKSFVEKRVSIDASESAIDKTLRELVSA
jgi:hypothetical protein